MKLFKVFIALMMVSSMQVAQADDLEQPKNHKTIVVRTEEDAKLLAQTMTEQEKEQFKSQINSSNCKSLYSTYFIGPGYGLSSTVVFIPVGMAWMILGLPVAAVDSAMGCENPVSP